jgi:hypothetical protein
MVRQSRRCRSGQHSGLLTAARTQGVAGDRDLGLVGDAHERDRDLPHRGVDDGKQGAVDGQGHVPVGRHGEGDAVLERLARVGARRHSHQESNRHRNDDDAGPSHAGIVPQRSRFFFAIESGAAAGSTSPSRSG